MGGGVVITDEMAIGQARSNAVAACLRAGATREQAEDAAQQALLEAWRSECVLDRDRPLSAWLQTTAYRRYLDHHRATRRESSVGLDSQYWHVHDPTTASVDDALLAAATARQGVASLTELPAQTQSVVQLVASGHSVGQVAATLKTTPASVSNALYRARQHIKQSMALPTTIIIASLTIAARVLRRATPGLAATAPAIMLALAIHDTARPITALDDAVAAPARTSIGVPLPAATSRTGKNEQTVIDPAPVSSQPPHVDAPRPVPAPSPTPTTVVDAGLVTITSEPFDGPSTPVEVLMYCLERLRIEPYIGCAHTEP